MFSSSVLLEDMVKCWLKSTSLPDNLHPGVIFTPNNSVLSKPFLLLLLKLSIFLILFLFF